MFPNSKSNCLILPDGASITYEYLGFQINILFGFISFLIFITFPLLLSTIMSSGRFIKKVCIPNLVCIKKAVEGFLSIAPKIFSLTPFKKMTSIFTFLPLVTFSSTYLLYNTHYVAEN